MEGTASLEHLEAMRCVQQHYAHAHVFRSLFSFMLCFVLFLWILASRCRPSAKFFPSVEHTFKTTLSSQNGFI